MATRLGELVERFGGQLVGDPNLEVTRIAPLADAGATDISFLSNSKLRAQAAHSGAARAK
jgi:UDP-3-O-[3-hydroxymyristoyl] glucosamine N-acyltransferase